LEGKENVVSGWKNKLQAALAHVTSSAPVAELQRKKPNLLRQKLTAENLLNRAAQDSANSELC
jgi:hypothetical protein